jgi:hypothetical protein
MSAASLRVCLRRARQVVRALAARRAVTARLIEPAHPALSLSAAQRSYSWVDLPGLIPAGWTVAGQT